MLDRVEFYRADLDMLRALGYDLHVATSPRELRPADLVFVWWWTWAFIPVSFARALGAPVVVTGAFDLFNFAERPWHERALIQYSLRAATVNVFDNQQEFAGVPARYRTSRPRLVHHSVDVARYAPGPGPRRTDLVVTLATMRHWNAWRKSIPELIAAVPLVCAERPDVRFVLAGDHEPRYPTLAAEVGASDAVTFPGVISAEQKLALMRECTLYLQPSRHEGFGVAIAEAAACGAPVVTSAVGAVPEVIGDAALYVDGTSPASIAEGVLALLNDAEHRTTLGRAGRARIAEHYSRELHIERWRAVLSEVL